MKKHIELRRAFPRSAKANRGAVLYIALIMLVLLALLGIVGLQVAGMQERMAASYRAINLAFQNAEATLRSNECLIQAFEDKTNVAGCAGASEARLTEGGINRRCDEGFDVSNWLTTQNVASAPAVTARQIDECVVGESPVAMGVGPKGNVAPIRIYQITTYNVDSTSNRTSAAAIDSIYKL